MKNLVYIALFTAFIYVLGYIPIIQVPGIAIPIVMQNLGILLAASVLGSMGVYSVLLLLVLAAIGLPVLAGGRGGIAVFFGPTSGYLLGYVVAALVIGALTVKSWRYLTFSRLFFINLIGVLLIYVLGIPVLMMIANLELAKAVQSNLVFIPGDVLKALLSAFIAMQFRKHYPLINKKY